MVDKASGIINVLYVDDEQDLLEIGKLFLGEDKQLSVDTALSVEMALQALEKKRYDVIVSDYQMPEINGIDFLKMVNKKCEIPFILFTGRGREEVAMEAINNGASFYVQKGGEPRSQFDDLIHKIKDSVERQRLENRFKTANKTLLLLSSATIHDLNNLLTAMIMYLQLGAGHEEKIQVDYFPNG